MCQGQLVEEVVDFGLFSLDVVVGGEDVLLDDGAFEVEGGEVEAEVGEVGVDAVALSSVVGE